MTVQNGVLLTFPVVYVALLEEFGWGRGEAAGIYSVTTLTIGLTSPLAGFLLDRFGPRRLFVGGSLVTAGGMAATSVGRSLSHLYLTYGILTGIGQSALTSTPNMVVVSKWFSHGVGRAIALADIGTGLGVILLCSVLWFEPGERWDRDGRAGCRPVPGEELRPHLRVDQRRQRDRRGARGVAGRRCV